MIPIIERYKPQNVMTDSLNEDLLPCPFCGGRAEVMVEHSNEMDSDYVFVKCMRCECESAKIYSSLEYDGGKLDCVNYGEIMNAPQKLIALWNTRR